MRHGGLGVRLKPLSHTFAGRLDTLQNVEGETPRRLVSWYHWPPKKDAFVWWQVPIGNVDKPPFG